MKAYSLLPDTYIIADPCGRVMDKIRIFCEGIVNDILENACIFEREKQPAACRIGSKGDPIPHWRAEKCFFRCTCPRKNGLQFIFPPIGGKTLPRAFFVIVGKNILLAEAQNRRGVDPGGFAFCLREKRERGRISNEKQVHFFLTRIS